MSAILYELKAEITRRGLRTRQISEAIPVSYDRLIRVLNGYTPPDHDLIRKVRAFLKAFDTQQKMENIY
ncbi:MAG: hypothetical protein A2293_16090 [Elusimicrobia bacterium RIFOXYB2_FULL_49_7]|nr:MAG: hypothetical protein A2293_16090 [Elusimicrobia bacterium RIFOXYB2_FULL_49_7]